MQNLSLWFVVYHVTCCICVKLKLKKHAFMIEKVLMETQSHDS